MIKIKRNFHPKLFLSKKEQEQILEAIREAEGGTSSEIRVHLQPRVSENILEDAKRAFEKLGMTRTRHRNGVLIFIGVRDRRFALIGDIGIHAKVPEDFWGRIVRKMQEDFKQDRFADGIVHAIRTAGETLKAYFPPGPLDRNELPDRISYSV